MITLDVILNEVRNIGEKRLKMRSRFVCVALILAAFIFGHGCSKHVDPVQSLKSAVERTSRSQVNGIQWLVTAYDVQKTSSLVTPFVGYVEMKNDHSKFKVTLGIQDEHWVLTDIKRTSIISKKVLETFDNLGIKSKEEWESVSSDNSDFREIQRLLCGDE